MGSVYKQADNSRLRSGPRVLFPTKINADCHRLRSPLLEVSHLSSNQDYFFVSKCQSDPPGKSGGFFYQSNFKEQISDSLIFENSFLVNKKAVVTQRGFLGQSLPAVRPLETSFIPA